MVVVEGSVADVVFVIEATANISPYVEALKNHYILPALEHFTGGPPDDRDIGFDNNYNCSMFAIVPYVTFSSAPDVASSCLGPTSSSYKFLQLFDRIPFIGGGGEGLSHVTEGVATALQCFEDFKEMRESVKSSTKPKAKSHCILICNSPPYDTPSIESESYSGMFLDDMAQVMADKEISFSIFAPRKMSFLFKMFEKAGGDLQIALSKKYAKDPRHLILLNGFQLQERPASPQHPTPVGQKRPHSPSPTRPTPNTHPSPTQTTLPRGPVPPPPPPPPFSRPAAPDIKPRGASPAPRPSWSPSPVPSPQPPPPSALAMQLSQRASGPMNPLPPGPPTLPMPPQMATSSTLPLMTSSAPRASGINRSAINVPRPGQNTMMTGPVPTTPRMMASASNLPQPPMPPGPNSGMMNQQLPNTQMANSQSNPQMVTSQIGAAQMVNQQMPNAPMSNQPMSGPIGMMGTQMTQSIMNQQQMQASQSIPMMSMGQSVMSEISAAGGMSQASKRVIVWQGQLDYQEKVASGPGQATGNMVKYQLPCSISSNVVQGAPEVMTEDWPKSLTIQLLPRTLIAKLTPIFKNSSIHVGLHFSDELSSFESQQGKQKLTLAMSSSSVGCIQFQTQTTKIMIVIYMNDKKVFVGFIPRDQEAFLNTMRETVAAHKKPQGPPPTSKGKPGQQPTPNQQPNMPMVAPAMNRIPMVQNVPQNASAIPGQTGGLPQQMGMATQGNPSGQFFQPGQQQQIQQMGVVGQMPGQVIGPQQASNMLLNQALGPMTPTQIRGQQQLNQQMGQTSQQPMMQHPMSQQGPMNVPGSRVRAPNVTMGTPQLPSQAPQQGGNFDRQQNSQTIKHLEAMLAEAKRNEINYAMQSPQGQIGPGQMAPQQQQQGQPMGPQQGQPMGQQQGQPMGPQQGQAIGHGMGQPPIRQHLQAHLQSAQHQQQRMAMNQPQMQQTPTGVTANPQLKHLLQQQQIRNIPPGPGQQMQQQQPQQQMNMNQIRMQQQMMSQLPQQMQQQPQQQWDQMEFNQQ